ncbi:MAG: OmpA family protein [Methylotenera sp.]|uniref:OmpA family protein n=1 Tax=Methylotenera sp. TaxID=2051956 RepID=UPI002718726B|nr:OmpA family protein [Methylotenera sp.]MDO9394774.1 OmpA family protein [Methylotenera sp.]MDP1522192.1 OmpA family protein [Methylotenera sp.]MDP2230939.1 OmpA family protein [Methylotenera sp.]MDP3140889.1 OmpA family protein [Methylotenera sp.]MDP3817372.1 OmpA family protein [Methylotenera sp.]
MRNYSHKKLAAFPARLFKMKHPLVNQLAPRLELATFLNKFRLSPRIIATPLLLCLTLQGCVTTNPKTGNSSIKETFKQTFASDDPCANNARNIGILAGTILGGVIGSQIGDSKTTGILLGIGIGGALGAFIGSEVDNRQCALSKIGQKYGLDMQVTPLAVSTEATPTDKTSADTTQKVGLSVSVVDVDGKPQFTSGSGELQAEAKQHFSEIAKQYSAKEQLALISKDKTEQEKKVIFDELRKKRILLIGHTDDTGNSKTNADLSEKRAQSVAKLFKSMGVEESQLFYQGAGETMPADDNATPEGRAKNRRVEIVDLTNEEAFKLYLQNKRAKTEYYRAIDVTKDVTNAKSNAETSANTSQAETKATNKVPFNKKEKVTVTTKKVDQKTTTTKDTSIAKTKVLPRSWIDFGGAPVTRENSAVNIGEVAGTKPKFALISTAQASDMRQISACNLDRPRDSGSVKSLKDGKAFATNDHLPGLNGRSWQDTVGGNLVVLNHVAVLRDGATLANAPELKVYSNYNPNKNRNPKPDVLINPPVNTYQGSNGVIYRVFAQGAQGLQCMDILMPADSSGISKEGKIIYGDRDNTLVADFKPKMIR